MHINYPIEVQEIDRPEWPQQVYKGEDYSIRAFPLLHSRLCVGYSFEEESRPGIFYPEKAEALSLPRGPNWGRLQNGESVTLPDGRTIEPAQVLGKARPGRKVSYVTDTGWRDDIAPEVANSDLLICEAMFAEEHAETALEKKHLTARQAGRLAVEAGGIQRMGLIHYSPRYVYRELKILRRECREIFPEAFLCRDQMMISLPYPDDENTRITA